jgi:hypothetical protein
MLHARLAVLAFAATTLVAAGCGDNKKTDTAKAPTTTQTTANTTDTTTTPPTTSTTGHPKTVDAAITAAVASCKSSIDAQPTLKANVKADLKTICEKAASGDAAAVVDATKQVCTKIVESSVPAGAARDQALTACKTSTGG